MADVCRYQNDGTETIEPAKFIERAESQADGWHEDLDRAVTGYLNGGGESVLREAAIQIASDISKMCDRIKTKRLKMSFSGDIKET